jgi:hypothetical protein
VWPRKSKGTKACGNDTQQSSLSTNGDGDLPDSTDLTDWLSSTNRTHFKKRNILDFLTKFRSGKEKPGIITKSRRDNLIALLLTVTAPTSLRLREAYRERVDSDEGEDSNGASSAAAMAQVLAEKEERKALAWFVDNAQLWRYDKSPSGPSFPGKPRD